MVIDLEDAITDPSVDAAVHAAGEVLAELNRNPPESLLFVRVRSAAHIRELALALGAGQRIVSGFVLPKFGTKTGEEYLQAVDAHKTGRMVSIHGELKPPGRFWKLENPRDFILL